MRHLSIFKTIKNLARNIRFHTLGFDDARETVHQDMISQIFPQSDAAAQSQSEPPTAMIVMGGAGSGKTQVAEQLARTTGYVNIDSDEFQTALVQHEIDEGATASPQQLHRDLRDEAIRVRQEALYQASQRRKSLILQVAGADPSSIQASIDALRAEGYRVELHLVDVDEAVALDRVAKRNTTSGRTVPLSYAKKSNRKAKAAWRMLSDSHRGKITTHRWCNNQEDVKPQMDDDETVRNFLQQFIVKQDQARQLLYQRLSKRDKEQDQLVAHMGKIAELQSPDAGPSVEAILLAIVSDMAIFPELYRDQGDQLTELFSVLDRSDLQVYYVSKMMGLPVKSHGGVVVASPKLAQGMGFSTGGDARRSRHKLSDRFRTQLLQQLEANKVDKALLEPLRRKDASGSWAIREFDTHALQAFIREHASSLLETFDGYLFDPEYMSRMELWSKPRSTLQKLDTAAFNRQYATHLKETAYSSVRRALGHAHHAVTRDVAIRPQSHVPCSQVLKRWLDLEARKAKLDQERKLVYQLEVTRWSFGNSPVSDNQGNCNTMAGYLLGDKPVTASVFNVGVGRARRFALPAKPAAEEDIFAQRRGPRSGNRYDLMLQESHMAKLMVHHPQPYQAAILKVNQHILASLDRLGARERARLAVEVKQYFTEFNPANDTLGKFLQQKLTSELPQDLYRSVLFHKFYFEEMQSKSFIAHVRDRCSFFQMRPAHLFGTKARGQVVDHEAIDDVTQGLGVSAFRESSFDKLRLQQDSFNGQYAHRARLAEINFNSRRDRHAAVSQAESERTQYMKEFREQVVRHDGLFYSGVSGTVTTVLPYVFGEVLEDDPLAQEDYAMAAAAAMSYAGHHSMLEVLLPLQHMGEGCPARLQRLQFDEQFYQKVMTSRFKQHIHAERGGEGQSLWQQSQNDFLADKQKLAEHLRTQPEVTAKSKTEKDRILTLLSKKLGQLKKEVRCMKHAYLFELQRQLLNLQDGNVAALTSIQALLTQAANHDVDKFEGWTSFSRFRSGENKVTETRSIVDQVSLFVNRPLPPPFVIPAKAGISVPNP